MKNRKIANIEFYKDHALLSINPKIYPLDVIYSAAYILMDKAYIILDGDPNNKIIVEIRAKKKQDLKNLANEFNDELLNYAVYKTQSTKNAAIKQALIQRALLTNEFSQKTEEDYTKDQEGIAMPWEEKYGKKGKNKQKK